MVSLRPRARRCRRPCWVTVMFLAAATFLAYEVRRSPSSGSAVPRSASNDSAITERLKVLWSFAAYQEAPFSPFAIQPFPSSAVVFLTPLPTVARTVQWMPASATTTCTCTLPRAAPVLARADSSSARPTSCMSVRCRATAQPR